MVKSILSVKKIENFVEPRVMRIREHCIPRLAHTERAMVLATRKWGT
jgi:hypothetical protein